MQVLNPSGVARFMDTTGSGFRDVYLMFQPGSQTDNPHFKSQMKPEAVARFVGAFSPAVWRADPPETISGADTLAVHLRRLH